MAEEYSSGTEQATSQFRNIKKSVSHKPTKKTIRKKFICIVRYTLFSCVLVDSFFPAWNLFRHGGPLAFHFAAHALAILHLQNNNKWLSVMLRWNYMQKDLQKTLCQDCLDSGFDKWTLRRVCRIFFRTVFDGCKWEERNLRQESSSWQNNRVPSIYQLIKSDLTVCLGSKWAIFICFACFTTFHTSLVPN